MKEENKKKGFIQIPLLIGIIFSIVVISGIGYGAVEYNKTSKLVEEAGQLAKEEKYDEAIEKLKSVQNKWLVKNLGVKKQEIADKTEENKKDLEDKLKFTQSLEEFNEANWQKAISSFSEIPENSFYYKDAQLKIEEAKRKMVEEELSGEKIARIEAEQQAQGEAIKRSQEEVARKIAEEKAKEEVAKRAKEEAKRAQEELERKIAEQKLSEKEAEEKRMNADNDGDGLTYGEELKLGTSDLDPDSDGDGISDGEDLNPAGGGRKLAQHFEWSYGGKIWTWNYSIHEDWYEYYKNKPRSPHGLEYVTEDDPFMQEIAKALKEGAEKENYHLSSFIVSFVQGLPYIEDYYTSFDEYPKYPIETFIERNGDCEDTSYLFASLINATELGASLIEFHNHMGVGVNTMHSQSGYYYPIGDEWYYYYETTGEGWEIGELPSDYLYENAKITRVWDGSIHYSYPQHIKPCYSSPDFVGYYYDGSNYYSDSQCNSSAYCLPYEDLYYNHRTESFYWDSSCTQKVVSWCSESIYHLGYFFSSLDYEYYLDSICNIPVVDTTTPLIY